MFIEMGITIEQLIRGFLRRILNKCFSNDVLTARIPGLAYGISPVLAIFPPATPPSSQLGNYNILCTSFDKISE